MGKLLDKILSAGIDVEALKEEDQNSGGNVNVDESNNDRPSTELIKSHVVGLHCLGAHIENLVTYFTNGKDLGIKLKIRYDNDFDKSTKEMYANNLVGQASMSLEKLGINAYIDYENLN